MKSKWKGALIGGIVGVLVGIFLIYLPSLFPSGNFFCGLEHLNLLEYLLCKFDIIARITCGNCINAFEGIIYFVTRPLYGLIIGALIGYKLKKK